MAYSTSELSGYASCFSYKPNCEVTSDIGAVTDDGDATRHLEPIRYLEEPGLSIVHQDDDDELHQMVQHRGRSKPKRGFETLKIVDNRYLQPHFFCPLLPKLESGESKDDTDSNKDVVDVETVGQPGHSSSSRPSENLTSETSDVNTIAYRIPLRLVNNKYSQPHFFLPQLQRLSEL